MYAPERTESAVAVSSFATRSGDVGGRIDKVLVLNGNANSALAALLSGLEQMEDAPAWGLAANQREALLDLRRAAYGY